MSRAKQLIFVTGTSTEVGKTWVAARLVEALRARGLTVSARKPVQSFEDGSELSDADVLAAATGEAPHVVCPEHRWYPMGLAPPMAAHALSAPPFTIRDLVCELVWPDALDIGVVEGAGGLRSPLAADGDNLDLLHALRPDVVVLVADAELGTINAVRLTIIGLQPYRPVVVLNRFDPGRELHRRNLEWLTAVDGLDVVTTPVAVADRLRPI